MAKPKFTPAPLRVWDRTNVMAGKECVAMCGGRTASHEPERTRFYEENGANARLYAQAPDLYDTLREIIDEIPNSVEYGDWPEMQALVTRAEAILAKVDEETKDP